MTGPEQARREAVGAVGVPSAQQVAEVVVELADTDGADFDLSGVLYALTARSVELLDVDTAGLLLADEHDRLNAVASSHEGTRMLELFQLQVDEGPCVECFRTGAVVSSSDLDRDEARWPTFVPRALEEGVHSVYAVPMEHRGHVIGGLNLFRCTPDPLPDADLALAQSFATATTIGVLHTRRQHSSAMITAQLEHALNSRVIIEQAKGYLAERHHVTLSEAFDKLRTHARSRNLRLHTVARDVVSMALDLP